VFPIDDRINYSGRPSAHFGEPGALKQSDREKELKGKIEAYLKKQKEKFKKNME
jgi:hypothetical protein